MGRCSVAKQLYSHRIASSGSRHSHNSVRLQESIERGLVAPRNGHISPLGPLQAAQRDAHVIHRCFRVAVPTIVKSFNAKPAKRAADAILKCYFDQPGSFLARRGALLAVWQAKECHHSNTGRVQYTYEGQALLAQSRDSPPAADVLLSTAMQHPSCSGPHMSVSPALTFEVLATQGRARASRMTLPHFTAETPMFMPVGTQGVKLSLIRLSAQARLC